MYFDYLFSFLIPTFRSNLSSAANQAMPINSNIANGTLLQTPPVHPIVEKRIAAHSFLTSRCFTISCVSTLLELIDANYNDPKSNLYYNIPIPPTYNPLIKYPEVFHSSFLVPHSILNPGLKYLDDLEQKLNIPKDVLFANNLVLKKLLIARIKTLSFYTSRFALAGQIHQLSLILVSSLQIKSIVLKTIIEYVITGFFITQGIFWVMNSFQIVLVFIIRLTLLLFFSHYFFISQIIEFLINFAF